MKLRFAVLAETAIAVIQADDATCIARKINCDRHAECRDGRWPGPCRDLNGQTVHVGTDGYRRALTLDHVQDQLGVKKGMTVAGSHRGRRAVSDPAHLATVCCGHMEYGARAGAVWNLAHRPEMRSWLIAHR